jgi:hypothetical protein
MRTNLKVEHEVRAVKIYIVQAYIFRGRPISFGILLFKNAAVKVKKEVRDPRNTKRRACRLKCNIEHMNVGIQSCIFIETMSDHLIKGIDNDEISVSILETPCLIR